MSSRASAMTPPGMVLSQPTSTTSPSNRLPRATSSIESAMTSRLTSEARIPSLPMVMPSEIDTVLNSIGVPPAARIPSLMRSPSRRRWKLQGPISGQVLATPMIGRLSAASSNPTAFSMARAGAREGPSVMAPLRRLPGIALIDILQPVVTVPLHSAGAAARSAALLLGQILPGILPRRAGRSGRNPCVADPRFATLMTYETPKKKATIRCG